ncbi:hypothetical protein [Amycolatopsis thermoflava]|uniref:hypothetical protein n=1 Tax=Amycolatopsis thermoflava TaxID=84480 RepID=UPI0011CE62B8|nr:hypothetical protein [Amycolatopsis thermoflava]
MISGVPTGIWFHNSGSQPVYDVQLTLQADRSGRAPLALKDLPPTTEPAHLRTATAEARSAIGEIMQTRRSASEYNPDSLDAIYFEDAQIEETLFTDVNGLMWHRAGGGHLAGVVIHRHSAGSQPRRRLLPFSRGSRRSGSSITSNSSRTCEAQS